MTESDQGDTGSGYRSLVPARLDRLPWNRFHTLVVLGLGVSWVLDGLEIQIVSQIGAVLADRDTLSLTGGQVGLLGSVYLFGEVLGALGFGRLADRLGRRRLFFATLTLYMAASALAALSTDLSFLLLCRFLAGAGIGGEYTAINSAIDELIPAYYRGRVDIMINSTYWFGALLGSAANVFLLDPARLPVDLGWRIGFLLGPVLALAVIGLRFTIKESPRWLMTHGHQEAAESVVDEIETNLRKQGIEFESIPDDRALKITGKADTSYRTIARTMLGDYRRRSILGFTVMVTQAVLYNAVFFTYSLVLVRFFAVPDRETSYLFLPFAAANLIGPLVLAPLFDTVGRRRMITFSYAGSGLLLSVGAWLFSAGLLTAVTLTALWCVIFFFASAGASSAYLTISEIFPLEMRAQAISFFFAISILVGGVAMPTVFSRLIGTGTDPVPLAHSYLALAAVMILGGVVAWFLGVDAERKSLEEIANPLSTVRHDIEPPIRPT